MLHEEDLTSQIIGAAIEVHRELGPGLLESAYEECFCHELNTRAISFRRQVPFPVAYKRVRLDCGYRADLIVDNRVVVELKAIDQLTDLHKAQLLTYLRITRLKVGLLFNFNVEVLKNGLVRLVL
ncbi:MAG: GxxExxY protein [Pirellulales bacterium]